MDGGHSGSHGAAYHGKADRMNSFDRDRKRIGLLKVTPRGGAGEHGSEQDTDAGGSACPLPYVARVS
jgi:hypothetical protein